MSEKKFTPCGELWDSNTAIKSKVLYKPRFRRRGPEKPKFPMRPKKALILLTGRSPLAKAETAFLHYAVARRMIERGWPKQFAKASAEKELRHNLESDWKLDFFKDHALEYTKYPRPNFDAARHKRRLSKILFGLSAKQPSQ